MTTCVLTIEGYFLELAGDHTLALANIVVPCPGDIIDVALTFWRGFFS